MQIPASNPGLPVRARNSSCNPKRAAGSEHAGLLAHQHPASEILFKFPPGAGHEDERGLCGMPVARKGVKSQQSLGRLPKTSAGSAGWASTLQNLPAPRQQWIFPGSVQVESTTPVQDRSLGKVMTLFKKKIPNSASGAPPELPQHVWDLSLHPPAPKWE